MKASDRIVGEPQPDAVGECEPCRARGQAGVPAERAIEGTAMCGLCFESRRGSEVRLVGTCVPAPRRGGGRLAKGWPGGLRIVQATVGLPPGAALRLDLPVGIPANRARWGIYRAAQLHGVRVSIACNGNELTVRKRESASGR